MLGIWYLVLNFVCFMARNQTTSTKFQLNSKFQYSNNKKIPNSNDQNGLSRPEGSLIGIKAFRLKQQFFYKHKKQNIIKFQYSTTKTCLEFRILVIVICL